MVQHKSRRPANALASLAVLGILVVFNSGCGSRAEPAGKTNEEKGLAGGNPKSTVVSVATIEKRPLESTLTLSSELVPFQEIDVYAKEAGYVKQLLVDYGTHVRQGQLMAVLEIPELQAQLEQDQAAIKAASDQVARVNQDVGGYQAQANVAHLVFTRISGVAQAKPGLVAQQEVDDAQGKDLSLKAQLESAKSNLANAQSQLEMARAKLKHDQDLYAYSKITAPFAGVVTQRYANLGALMQAGTNSSTQAMPLVRLSQENLFRLSIPVPESDVRYVRIGNPIEVRVPSLAESFEGRVTRLSVQVAQETRTMYTEVDVPNTRNVLMPGLYAEAIVPLQRKGGAPAVPLEAVDRQGARNVVYVVTAQNKIEPRDVTLGIETPDYAEILKGLEIGDRVVVSDRTALMPGEIVTAKPAEHMSYSDNKADKS